MAATPVFDELTVQLAARLGDPYTPAGVAVGPTTDGIAYTATMRAEYLTTATRNILNTLGHRGLLDAGYVEGYVREFTINANPMNIPAGVARVLYVDYYGRKALLATFDMLKRRHHTHWQHVPMYRIYDDAGTKKMELINFQISPPNSKCYYLKTVPALSSGGSEDILFSTPVLPLLLSTAEIIGRRNHQELTTHLQQPLQGDVMALKGA